MMRRALAVSLLAAACGGTPAPAGPVIARFDASAAEVVLGDAITLSWAVDATDSLVVDPDVGPVFGDHITFSARDVGAVTYKLTATRAGLSSSATVAVVVKQRPSPATLMSLVASPDVVAPGDAVTLSWKARGDVSSAAINGEAVAAGASSLVVHPSATTSYRLTLRGAADPQPQPASVVVRVAPKPVIDRFDAAVRADVTLSWSAQNATSISITDGSATWRPAGASLVVHPLAPVTYTLTATGVTGTATRSVQVTPQAPAAGSRFVFTPQADAGADVAISADTSVDGTVVLSFVAQRDLAVGGAGPSAFALNLPLSGARLVKLRSAVPGLNAQAIDPGPGSPAAAAVLPASGPLAGVLSIGVGEKGGTSAAAIAAGTVLCSVQLDLAQPYAGVVFDTAGTSPRMLVRGNGFAGSRLAGGRLEAQ